MNNWKLCLSSRDKGGNSPEGHRWQLISPKRLDRLERLASDLLNQNQSPIYCREGNEPEGITLSGCSKFAKLTVNLVRVLAFGQTGTKISDAKADARTDSHVRKRANRNRNFRQSPSFKIRGSAWSRNVADPNVISGLPDHGRTNRPILASQRSPNTGRRAYSVSTYVLGASADHVRSLGGGQASDR